MIDQELIINTILNDSQDTVYFKDKESKYILSSKAHSSFFDVDNPQDIIGKSDYDFFPPEFADETRAAELEIMETGIPVISNVERWEEYKGRGVMWFASSKYPFYNQDGNLIGIWGTSKNITLLKKAEEELERVNARLEQANKMLQRLSDIDSLSGLYNHRCFYETVEKTIEDYLGKVKNRTKKSFCLLLSDIDCFKEINDTYGHLVGDKAIKHIADIIISNTRPTDICFRYGGDEFAVLLLDVTEGESIKLSERIRKVVEESPLKVHNGEIHMTLSIGITLFDKEEDVTAFVNKTDKKLYKSKQRGRNIITC